MDSTAAPVAQPTAHAWDGAVAVDPDFARDLAGAWAYYHVSSAAQIVRNPHWYRQVMDLHDAGEKAAAYRDDITQALLAQQQTVDESVDGPTAFDAHVDIVLQLVQDGDDQ